MFYSTRSKLICSFLGVSLLVGTVSLFIGVRLLNEHVLGEAANRVRLDLNAAGEMYRTRIKYVIISLHITTLGSGFISTLKARNVPDIVNRLERMAHLAELDFAGMDVIEELDRISPGSAVVMISGHPTLGRATEAMKRGAMDYVAKPFTPEEIVAAVKKAMNRKVRQEKKTIGRFENIMKTWQFPVPSLEDKTPKTIAETVASTVGVGKATSPWFSVFVLGILAGAYIGFGGLLSTAVTFDLAVRAGVGIQKIVAGSAFSLGLILVVIAGAVFVGMSYWGAFLRVPSKYKNLEK